MEAKTKWRNLRFPLLALISTLILGTSLWCEARAESILYTFMGGVDGGYPYSSLIFDGNGNLYGTTEIGGFYGKGTVFELTPNAGSWTETVLYNFGTNSADGIYPQGSVIFDSAGNLHGTTYYGGSSTNCGFGCGTIFQITPGSNGWTETALYSFVGSNGQNPRCGLVMDSKGSLYGTTEIGGSHGAGTVFQLSGSQLRVLHNFGGVNDGANPFTGVTLDSKSNVYGTTFSGGPNGAGMVFKLSRAGDKWQEKVLHSFTNGKGIGGYPEGGVTFDKAGDLYGTTTQLGMGTVGGVFKLRPISGAKWSYSVLYGFTGGTDGSFPGGNVILDSARNLYGTTQDGGVDNDGTVFKLTPTTKGPWKETLLYSFTGGSDGRHPESSGLVLDGSGNLYGTTLFGGTGEWGDIFEILH